MKAAKRHSQRSAMLSLSLLARRKHLRLVVVLLLAAVAVYSAMSPPPAHAVSTLVINEFRSRGPNGANDEFIEIYNNSAGSVNIGGYKLSRSNSSGGVTDFLTITAGTVLNSGCRYLVTNNNATGGYSGSVPGDQTYGTGFADDGGLALLNTTNNIIDQVGMSAGSSYGEGVRLAPQTANIDQSYTRGGALDNGTDTDSNNPNFVLRTPSNPQNLSSTCFTPTAVKVASFTAMQAEDRVLLEWQTGYEVNNLGFNLYRERDGRRTRVNPSIIAGSALLAGAGTRLTAGQSYTWVDTLPKGDKDVWYWLEDIDLDGTRTLHGPVTPVKVADGGLSKRHQAMLLSQLRATPATGQVALQSWPAALNSEAQQRLALSQIDGADAEDRQQALAGQAAVKLRVRRDGWYRVGQPELVAAGLDASVAASRLQLYADGVELPIKVSGDQKRFGPTDFIEFYGTAMNTPSSDTRTYWLIAGTRPGRRITVDGGGRRPVETKPSAPISRSAPAPVASSRGPAVTQSFAYTVERRERTVYFAALQNGEAENFFGPVIATEPVAQTLTVSHLDATAAWPATLEVTLQGATAGAHMVRAQLNGQDLGTIELAEREHKTTRLLVAQSSLLAGENTLTLTAMNGEADVSVVDWVRLTYAHTYRADNDLLRFSLSASGTARIDGFSTPQIRVVDITKESAIQELRVQPEATGNGYAVSIPPSRLRMRGSRILLAFADTQAKHPAAILANEPSNWHSTEEGADLVVITHAGFIKSAEELAEARRSQGLRVAVVDVEDIYDEFSYGAHSPQAIKDFLQHAQASWSRAPRYAVFIGDASFDPRNYLGQGAFDLVPTKLVDTAYLETASDDSLADFDDDGLPEMLIGRLPARTAAEAAVMVAKTINYLPAALGQEALLVADRSDGFDFEAVNNEVRALLPSTMTVQTINRGDRATETVRNEIIAGLNVGPLLVNYVGHGSVERWAGAGLLTSSDARALSNGQDVPLMVMMTCLNGFFQDVYTESLAEALLKAEQGGAVAVWTSSGLTPPEGQAQINAELYRQLFGGAAVTLGEAARAAKRATADSDVRRTWILLGDPTLRIR